jgi:UDP-N-acetylglucosamine--N-acetylmuramyl-(pentapeptide) pyrophosphoryl-undecaprenol N-acetylglucosamine transferase
MSRHKKIRVLVTGGGTGGHIYPLIAVISELQMLASGEGISLRIRYLGAPGEFKNILKENGIEIKTVLSSKFRRYSSLKNLIDVPKFVLSLFQALWKMYWFMPNVVFSKGGPGAFAVVLAARFYRIPVIIHESDSIPSLTGTLTGRFSGFITTAFQSTAKYFERAGKRVEVVGNPVRRYLFSEQITQEKARAFLGFDKNLPLILVIGSSQGSTRINDFILDNLREILLITQVFHQTGRNNYENVVREYMVIEKDLPAGARNYYKAIDYFEKDIRIALTAADIVVGRSSAGTIFESAAFGKPTILIPLPESAGNHQLENAIEYSSAGGAVVIEESNLLPHIFIDQIRFLLSNPTKLVEMSKAAQTFYKPDAALKLAQIILTINK